ncbi:A24 family peptidase [Variovorax sp. LT1R16]|uniref:A24 family peptidase n=1 Tax=Variovorax sp. LT1R16 TaxID=3443728 RepID=UPI003F478EE2
MTAALWSWLLATGIYDFQQRRVPNWLVLVGAMLAAIAMVTNMQPLSIEWPNAALGAVAGFSFLLIFYATGLMGAGDVKFGGALGLWFGLQPLLPIWLGASLLAGAHASLLLLLRRLQLFPRLTEALSGKPTSRHDGSLPQDLQRHIPFAAYLAIASVGWLIWDGPSL